MRPADVDDVVVVDGQTSAEPDDIVQLRRGKRRLAMESEMRRAAACFGRR